MSMHFISLLILLISISVTGAAGFAADANRLAQEGGEMDEVEKNSLEKLVADKPEDIASRTKLLGYYFQKKRRDADVMSARTRHVLWLIENAPESEVVGLPYSQLDKILEREGYEKATQAWKNVIKRAPENLAAIENASRFFLIHDREMSEKMLLRGQKAEPESATWPKALGQLYSLELIGLPTGAARMEMAEKAFHQYQLAYQRSEPIGQNSLLENLAKFALEAGLIDDAKDFADTMLTDDTAGWNSGNRIHHGNLILGRIALTQGDVAEAKTRLLAAGKTPGSPQLNSFGPNMMLAKELLELGELSRDQSLGTPRQMRKPSRESE